MRRVTGSVLSGLGVVLVAAAILLPTYVAGQIVKFPLNETIAATLAGTGVSYFSEAKLTEKTGVSVRATYTIKGDAAAGTSSTAVWNETSGAYDVTNNLPINTMTRRFAFNRRTAELVDCCGANVNGSSSVRQTGLVGYVFPIGTQKKTYDVFDTTLDKPVPFVYSGTADTDGVPTYVFIENVPPTKVTTITVPGAFFGLKAKTIALPEIYQIHLVYWVDPETGALINVNENEKVTLQNPQTGATVASLFDGDLVATPATVTAVVKLDSSGRTELSWLTMIGPLVAGIVGAVALIAGIYLLVRGKRQNVDAEFAGLTAQFAVDGPEAGGGPAGPAGPTAP
jgi:Porin PorA